jgi:hypothetical protein
MLNELADSGLDGPALQYVAFQIMRPVAQPGAAAFTPEQLRIANDYVTSLSRYLAALMAGPMQDIVRQANGDRTKVTDPMQFEEQVAKVFDGMLQQFATMIRNR